MVYFSVPNLTESNRSEIVGSLSKKVNIVHDKLQTTQKEHGEIEIKLQSKIDLIRVEKAKLDQEIKIKEKQIKENTTEIKKIKDDVEQVSLAILTISSIKITYKLFKGKTFC